MPTHHRRVYATSQLRPVEQFAFWRESICEAFAALDPVADAAAVPSFDSLVEVDVFDGTALSLVQSQPQRVVRGPAQIRRDPRERLFINVMLQGTSLVEQGGQRVRAQAGEVYLVQASQPYVLEHPEPFRLLCLDLPRERLPRPLLAQTRPAGQGRTGLAPGLLRQLRRDTSQLDAQACDDAMAVACGWLAQAFSQPDAADLGRAGKAAAVVGLQDLRQRAQRLIEARLRDPLLTPQAIADDLHVSLRYLHKAFAHHGATVAGTVRSLRLARCADEIASSTGRRTVAAIAQDWGFADVPNFHRLFRRHFGHAPGAHRREAAQRQQQR